MPLNPLSASPPADKLALRWHALAAMANTPAQKPRMHPREIDRLWGRVREKGYSIVPLKLYFKNGRAKVELGLAKGKHSYDKRAEIARKTSGREIERALKGRNR